MRAYPKLRLVVLSALALALALLPAAPAAASGFSLGVAAGEVKSTSAILWTRADKPGGVTLKVKLGAVQVASSSLQAKTANDNTVQKLVTRLKPGKTYQYFFVHGKNKSPVGTFKTAPSAKADKTIRFAFSGDTDAQRAKGQSNIFYNSLKGNNGLGAESFGIYRQMAAEKNDFNVNLGDTIYTDSEVPGIAPVTSLAGKRAKYRMNLAVANLRALRRSTGVYNHWDDHEFINDFTKAENGAAIYNAGVKAFLEYMPAHYASTGGLGLYNT